MMKQESIIIKGFAKSLRFAYYELRQPARKKLIDGLRQNGWTKKHLTRKYFLLLPPVGKPIADY